MRAGTANGLRRRRKRGADEMRSSVNVGLKPPALLQVAHEGDGLARTAAALLGDDVHQRPLDVLAHAHGAADVDMGAVGEPLPDFASDLAHAVLDVELCLVVP